MTFKHILILAAAIVCGFIGHAYVSAKMNSAKLDQLTIDVAAANKKADALIEQASQDRTAAAQRDLERSQELQKSLAAIAQQKQNPITAEQLAALITARIPSAPVTASQLNELPSAPIAQAGIKDYILDCDSCKVERDSLKLAVANRDTEISDLTKENTAMQSKLDGVTKERDLAVKSAKGTVLKRVFTAAKYVGIGIGIGALVVAHP